MASEGNTSARSAVNTAALHSFVFHVIRRWRRALQRRSQKGRMTTARMRPLVERWLPRVRIVHPYPSVRLGLKDLRQEPSAVALRARIRAGGAGKPASLPQTTGARAVAAISVSCWWTWYAR
jgi:hypothetical protein